MTSKGRGPGEERGKGARGEGLLACIDQQWPIDVCKHCIVLQGIINIPAKLEQVLDMLPKALFHQISLHSLRHSQQFHQHQSFSAQPCYQVS